jgi:restriction system protein
MARRKSLLSEFLDIVVRLSPLYLLLMASWWFTNKDAFWQWFFYVIGLAIMIIAFYIWRGKTIFKDPQVFLSKRQLLLKLREKSPTEFEEYIADLFSKLGYKTDATGRPNDHGVDVVAEKDGVKHYIQCKRFITSVVNVHDVRDFYGAIADHLAQSTGYFITTNRFTLEAERFANDKPIELIDGDSLVKLIHLADKENNKIKIQPDVANLEKCPQCGGDLVERDGKFGKFYGCSNYPRCHFTKK